MHCNTMSALLEHVAHTAHHFFFKAVVAHIQKADFCGKGRVVFDIASYKKLRSGSLRRIKLNEVAVTPLLPLPPSRWSLS